MKLLRSTILPACILLCTIASYSQVLDVNDPIVIYDENNPPVKPATNNVGKWVVTPSVNWDSDKWKSYYLNGSAMRLRFPNNYDPNRIEKYPLILILHGLGFRNGTIYMNDQHLNNSGAYAYEDAINDGKYDGFVLSPQSASGWFGESQANMVDLFLELAAQEINIDLNRVSINGRSGGAQNTWLFVQGHPTTYAALMPMSGVKTTSTDNLDALMHIPIWVFQGAKDNGPAPATTEVHINKLLSVNTKVRYTKYKNGGHGIFNTAYADPDFFNFIETAHKSNPAILKGDYSLIYDDNNKLVYEFITNENPCPTDPVSITLALSAGFSAYEWKKDDVLISEATSNELLVTELGIYEARFLRNGVWSDWSPNPIEVVLKEVTVTPDIEISGNLSRALPSLDGSSDVALELPQGYIGYEWTRVSDNSIVSTDRVFHTNEPGEYVAKVAEAFSCSSNYSTAFNVIDADSGISPETPLGFTGFASSETDLNLFWSTNLNDPNPAIGFEIFRGNDQSSTFSFVTVTDNNTFNIVDRNLSPNSNYYYLIRAIDEDGASIPSDTLTLKTLVDNISPTAPANLKITGANSFSVTLDWDDSFDDVAIFKYDVYKDGAKMMVTDSSHAVVYDLAINQIHKFTVVARDITGNQSPHSTRVIAITSEGNNALANFNFDENHNDGTYNNTAISTSGNPAFSTTDKAEGSSSLLFNGVNDKLEIDINDLFIHDEFSERSISFWFKPNTVTGIQDIYDEGGSTNGIGIRLVDTTLEFSVQDNHDIQSIMTPITIGIWQHIAAVFNNGSIVLYLNGIEMDRNDTLSFNEVSRHTDASGLGGSNGGNAFDETGNNFNGLIDGFFIFDEAIDLSKINDIMNNGSGISFPLETVLGPSDINAEAQSFEEIQLTWIDNDNNEIGFQIFRATEGGEFLPIANVSENTVSYLDSGLQPDTKYAYQIIALSEYNESTPAIVVTDFGSLTNLKLNDNITDDSEFSTSSSISGSLTYSTIDKTEGTHSAKFDGNTFINIDNGNEFIHDSFSQRSIAFWFKSLDAIGTQDIYDEGGSTNGIGIRLVDDNLDLTVQNSHDIFSVTAPISRNTWHHVAGIFDAGRLSLYLNGILINERSDISYTTVGSHGNAGGLGGTNSSNAFDVNSDNFNGFIDDFLVFDRAIDSEILGIIESVDPDYASTTFSLPNAPVAPTDLIATVVDYTSISLSFTDISDTEDEFEIWKSINNDQNFQYLSSTTDTSFVDDQLQGNITFFYKVLAVNAGGSTESNAISATTLNHLPTLGSIGNITMQYGTSYEIPLLASDDDNDVLSYGSTNLPSFASLTDYGDGSGLLHLTPVSLDEGTYSNISISVSDPFLGESTEIFELVVNGNNIPVLTNILDQTFNEGDTSTVSFSVSDTDGLAGITWNSNLPNFTKLTTNIDGTASLEINTDYTSEGIYNAWVEVADLQGGTDTQNFVITVVDVNPNTIVKVNFTDGSLTVNDNWNSTTGHPIQGNTYSTLLDTDGNATSFGVEIISDWNNNGSNILGVNTGNDSGLFPDAVIRTAYWTDASIQTIAINGLDDSKNYEFTFFGSRDAGNDRSTQYTSSGQSVVLAAQANTANTVSISNLIPTDGTIEFTVQRAGGSSYGYINALIIEEGYGENEIPAIPRNLSAVLETETRTIDLSWDDVAFNELGYEIARSETELGTYDVIATLNGTGISAYTDSDGLSPNTDYYYKIRAFNQAGFSDLTAPYFIAIPNFSPVIESISDQIMEMETTTLLNINATDDIGDNITITINNLPSFMVLSSVGIGASELTITPTIDDIGVYNIQVVATDQNGGSSNQTFRVEITPTNVHYFYINFAGSAAYSETSPWNNYVGTTTVGDQLHNISSNEESYQLSLELIDGWNGYTTAGMAGTGLYPDLVTQSGIYTANTSVKTIIISGFDAGNAYDFTIFGSRDGGGDRTMEYSINDTTVLLDAAYNTNNTVSINGAIPDENGHIILTVNKSASASYGYVNSVVIRGYQAEAIPATPSNLSTTPLNSANILIAWDDNTNLETGYEIWRSLDSQSGFSLLSTTTINENAYTDNGLSQGIVYYYQVRANMTGGSQTDFSNVSGSSTINSTVSINFNVTDPQTGWNNTNAVPAPELTFTNLTNDLGNPTGISFEILSENPDINPSFYGFSGDNPFGINTGNDSGVVPDNVMRSTWWMDPGRTAELRFYGLDLSKNYKFKLFASRDGGGNRTSTYTIGSESVSLNAAGNTQNIVELNNIIADQNGEIILSITNAENAMFSYLGGLIIESASNYNPNARTLVSKPEFVEKRILSPQISVYPNPVTQSQYITIQLDNFTDKHVNVDIISLDGKLMFNQSFEITSKKLVIDSNKIGLKTGIYFISIKGDKLGIDVTRLISK